MNVEELLRLHAAGERDFSGTKLAEANLSGVNLSKVNFTEANLSVANLCGSNLSESNFRRAKLNVAKLSGANLSKANLQEANLNVANLTLADFSKADMYQASMVRAEMARAELSGANLSYANLSGADLKDAKLRSTNLSNANISRADLKWTDFTAANLTQANLHGTDLSSANLSGVDLSNAELRQANLSRANLRGANLRGANLRWADLSGADLSWADLSGARLSGANLTGVNLNHATLLETILVHADLTRANLIAVEWSGSDLSGATLTGAKLHEVLRFGIKTEGILCEWVDLSPNGDQSNIRSLSAESLKAFFHETPPTVCLMVDAEFDINASYALAATYCQLIRQFQIELPTPNVRVGRRRTTFTFELRSDSELFIASYLATLPFKDAPYAHANWLALLKMLRVGIPGSGTDSSVIPQEVTTALGAFLTKMNSFQLPEKCEGLLKEIAFFKAPTQTSLINSGNKTLIIYNHPGFGKRVELKKEPFEMPDAIADTFHPMAPSMSALLSFIQTCYEWGSVSPSRNSAPQNPIKKQS